MNKIFFYLFTDYYLLIGSGWSIDDNYITPFVLAGMLRTSRERIYTPLLEFF